MMRSLISTVIVILLLTASVTYYYIFQETGDTTKPVREISLSGKESSSEAKNSKIHTTSSQYNSLDKSDIRNHEFTQNILSLISKDKKEIDEALATGEFVDAIKELDPNQAIEILSLREITKNIYLASKLADVMFEVRQQDIEVNDEWFLQMAKFEGKDQLRGLYFFKSLLAEKSSRFSAKEIENTINLGKLGSDSGVKAGLIERLNQEHHIGGEQGAFAMTLGYVVALPDSIIRDELNGYGYINHLDQDKILDMYEEVLETPYKSTAITDYVYARKLMEIGATEKVFNMYDHLVAAGNYERAGTIAQTIASNAQMNADDLYEWAEQLPDQMSDKQQIKITAFTKLVSSNPQKAKIISINEKDKNLKDRMIKVLETLN